MLADLVCGAKVDVPTAFAPGRDFGPDSDREA
jgi:hypothetical protein